MQGIRALLSQFLQILALEIEKLLNQNIGLEVVQDGLFTAMNEGSLAGVATGLSNVNTAINGSLGVEDVRSRIEPVTDAYKHLLPAIDGIGPNEVRPVTEMKYISTLLF